MFNPSRYRIIAVGKIRKKWIQDGVDLYLKRLSGLTIIEVRDSNPKLEAKKIQSTLKRDEQLITLTEGQQSLSSSDFAKRLNDLGSQRLAFVIGGADGLTTEIQASANWNLSLSPLTFPHEIARLLLVEQLYRAHTILEGGAYHRP